MSTPSALKLVSAPITNLKPRSLILSGAGIAPLGFVAQGDGTVVVKWSSPLDSNNPNESLPVVNGAQYTCQIDTIVSSDVDLLLFFGDNSAGAVHLGGGVSSGGGGGGDASAANQVLALTALDSIYDALQLVGTEATSADILAAVNSLGDGATLNDLATALAPLATEATQADILAALEAQGINIASIKSSVDLLVPDVDAMKDSLASINGKIPTNPAAAGDNMGANLRVLSAAVTTTNPVPVAPNDPLWLAASANAIGTKAAEPVTLFGRRSSATFANATRYNDMFSYLSSANETGADLTGSEVLEILSGSPNDTAAGTGAQSVKIFYINANAGDIQASTTVSLNGTTPVSLGALRSKNIQWMEVSTAGSLGYNDGLITLRTSGAGTTWESIPQYLKRSQSARYMVPAGKTAYIMLIRLSGLSQSMQFALAANQSEDGTLLDSVYIPHNIASIAANVSLPPLTSPFHKFVSGARIKLTVLTSSVTNAFAEGEFTFLLIDN